MHALIVEDSRAMQLLLSRRLTRLGFTTDRAGDGRTAAARMAADGPPDLLVVDHNLPGTSGLDIVRALRGRPATAHVRVLMVSAEGDLAFLADALDAGVDEYLFKPFTTDELTSKLTLLALPTSG